MEMKWTLNIYQIKKQWQFKIHPSKQWFGTFGMMLSDHLSLNLIKRNVMEINVE